MRVSAWLRNIVLVTPLVFGAAAVTARHGGGANSARASAGTLNIVLANKNGFVIATDSRRSSDTSFRCGAVEATHCDDSQKLFRTGAKSAMAIAGFAAGLARTPLDLSVAAMLRAKFGRTGRPGSSGLVGVVSQDVDLDLQESLTGVSSIFTPSTSPPDQMRFRATLAGVDELGKIQIITLGFEGAWLPTGPDRVLAPSYSVSSGVLSVAGFTKVTQGITTIADSILDCRYPSDELSISDYCKRVGVGTLDDMPLSEMEGLSRAILKATARREPKVGGPDQVGVFPVMGDVGWTMPMLPSDAKARSRIVLHKGLRLTKSGSDVNFPESVELEVEDFQQPLSVPIGNLFLASRFEDVSVVLDDNYFIDDEFQSVKLQWLGGPTFIRGSKCSSSSVEIPEGKSPPSGLKGCAIVRKKVVSYDASAIGLPQFWRIDGGGCVTKMAGGGLRLTASEKCPKITLSTAGKH